MTKEYLLKRIIESEKFKEQYWPDFEIKLDCKDYGPYITKGNNPFLKTLKTVIYSESDNDKSMKKNILTLFKL